MLRPWKLDIELRREPGIGLHAQIVQALIAEIRRGRLAVGLAMPGSRDLAAELGVNRKTIVQVYEELVAQGWLVTQGRRGTFVSPKFPALGEPENLSASPVQRAGKGSPSLLPSQKRTDARSGDSDWIDFNDGVPDTRLIPYAALARAFRHALIKTARTNQLGYGDPRGALALRVSLSRMLNMERGLASNEKKICLVRGSQMGIYVAARVLTNPGDGVVFERLSYSPAREAFQSFGANIILADQDENGLSIESVERACLRNKVKAVYVTPHHQYPTTVMLPADRRLQLLALAEKFGFMIVEDDYDHDFHFEHRPVWPLASIDGGARVIYIGSLSKGLAPGLRVGYLVAGEEFIDSCADVVSNIDRQGNLISELAVNELLESGELKRHLRRALKVYMQRRDSAVELIHNQLANFVEFKPPAGGLAVWLKLAKDLNAELIAEKIADYRVRIVSPRQYSVAGNEVTGLRLGYASLDQASFSRGIDVLRRVFETAI